MKFARTPSASTPRRLGATFVLLAVATIPAAARLSPPYFKESRPLVFDPPRICILTASETTDAALASALEAEGLRLESTEPLPDVAALNDALERARRASGTEPASPVFLEAGDRRMVVTEHWLLGLDRATSDDDGDTVARTLGSSFERRFAGMPATYRIRSEMKNGLRALDVAVHYRPTERRPCQITNGVIGRFTP
jgi:hypothetical protein